LLIIVVGKWRKITKTERKHTARKAKHKWIHASGLFLMWGVVGKLKKAQVKDNDSTDCRANNKLWIIHGWKERI
jgi:hypothetical protein